ncbi:MAG: hypothetical protein AB1422_04560 [bacterium]
MVKKLVWLSIILCSFARVVDAADLLMTTLSDGKTIKIGKLGIIK